MHTIYLEQSIKDHPRVQRIVQQVGRQAKIIDCQHYGEVFNPKAQNFRQQKQKPALILARKTGRLVLPTPEGFGIGGQQNYYFSHMLNCLYDCRYCFLQGMYRSANYVLFINYEDFMQEIQTTVANSPGSKPITFFSGYDGDSLAFEPVSHFLQHFLPFFASQPRALLELRSKSTNIQRLLQHPPTANVVVAFSFTPELISRQVEHKVPPLAKRLRALGQVAAHGWPIGLRFDPIIYHPEHVTLYQQLLAQIFQHITPAQVHSVSYGPLRFPSKMYQKLVKLYPDDPLLAQPLHQQQGEYTYRQTLANTLQQSVAQLLKRYVPQSVIFQCLSAVSAG